MCEKVSNSLSARQVLFTQIMTRFDTNAITGRVLQNLPLKVAHRDEKMPEFFYGQVW